MIVHRRLGGRILTVIPRSLLVGADRWSLRQKHRVDRKNSHGETDVEKYIVTLRKGLCAPEKKETLHHEIMHIAQWLAGIDDDDVMKAEEFIRRLSPPMYMTQKQNKAIRSYLFDA